MSADRIKCTHCSKLILPATAKLNDGLCAQCTKVPPAERMIVARVRADSDPLGYVVALYGSLIDRVTSELALAHFGGIADPQFESVRLYTFDSLSGSFDFGAAKEVGSDEMDFIELSLSALPSGYSLLHPLLRKLKSVSPRFNQAGKAVFFGSWGMGPAELGWCIRYLNDRMTFERYLASSGLSEQEVSAFDDAYTLKISQLE